MAMGTVEPQVATDAQTQTVDGFQLVIDALKLNGLDTIYGLPGIPITDLTRRGAGPGPRGD
jgi:oxalyl-CoA decarboxylase